ncbi:hypothetical protein EUX98_g3783 [Antrodiella citrinella]|uniref:NADP-dependent oxidoreductase domain-containing protein n=1 Tax=Antrodiella citrinella TaxID=2447956 RepID=A0A4S4MVP6_9APHY|nr:hypothetical protein EUX98_g3783 [Antrodiella citrinella]
MTASVSSSKLNNGVSIPSIGAGPGGADDVRQMVEDALKIGYRHIDTAWAYQNEEYVGQAIRNSGIPREEIYLVTKLAQLHHVIVQEALDISLKRLGVDYVDLYLMHWPQAIDANGKVLAPDQSPTFVETWQAMEKLLDTGKVKSIGVSNFSIKTLDILLPHVKIVPAVNQVEIHPLLPQFGLREYCTKKGILVTAYSPLGQAHPDLLQNDVLKQLAARKSGTVAQVIMGWFIKKGIVVIPKSGNPVRLQENFSPVEITDEDEAQIDAIHKAPGLHRSLLTKYHNPDGSVFGWSYEWLGWPYKKGGVIS